MAINFPNSPTLDQTFSSGNNTYIWNGNAWVGYSTVTSSGGTVVSSQWGTVATGIHTLSNVGIGTTNATSALTVKGNTSLETLNVSGVSTFSGTSNFGTLNAQTINVNTGGMNVADGIPIYFGNAAQGYISYGSGLFQIRGPGGTTPLILGAGPTAGANVRITSGDGNYNYAVFSGTGVTVTGTTFTNQLSVSGTTSTNQLSVSGVSTFTNNINLNTGNLKVATDGIIKIGNSDQLELYYNGSNGQTIKSTGDLRILTNRLLLNNSANDEQLIEANQNGSVALYYDNSKKFETLGTGSTTYGIHYATTFVGDGSGLTNIVATGSGVEIRDNGTIVGTASTIDFGDNLNVSAISAGVVTVTGGSPSKWTTVATGIHTLSNVGIGTTNVTSALTVKGNTSLETLNVSGVSTFNDQIDIYSDVNVGGSIGIHTTILNSSFVISSAPEYSAELMCLDGPNNSNIYGLFAQYANETTITSRDGNSYGTIKLNQYDGSSVQTSILIPPSGNIGIGTTNPTSKLTVQGNTSLETLNVSGVSTFTGRINSGHINAVGVVTATSFVGDGSGLTGVTATVVNPNSGVGTFAASVGVTTTIHTLASSIRTAEYLLFFQYNSNIQSQKILVMNNGTTAYSQEYAIMFEPNQIVSVGATVSGSNVLLQVTPKSGISGVTTFRYSAQTLE